MAARGCPKNIPTVDMMFVHFVQLTVETCSSIDIYHWQVKQFFLIARGALEARSLRGITADHKINNVFRLLRRQAKPKIDVDETRKETE